MEKNKILLIEDDKFISRAYSDGLTRAGLEVSVAEDGAVGLEKMKSEKPDLVLLDLIMPVKDGFDVLTEVKDDNQFKETIFVVLSNLGQEVDIEKAKQLGADDYLIKSDISMGEVIQKVESFLKN